ncbi:UxaA family hydrolase [Ruminococcaceae bacterium OttesenSCG-928-I18]|nr:UxaA family hydrolase [Ruminococcaceae bacterium OttesenSCG-928-I18]
MKIQGYRRKNGEVGIRNHLLVMPSVICACNVAERIAQQVPGSVYITHESGCGPCVEADRQRALKTFIGYGSNANVGACIVVGLGCEDFKAETIAEGIAKTGKPVKCINIQKEHGTNNAIRQGVLAAQQMMIDLSTQARVPVDLGEIILGLECGGSDTASGIAANPAVGVASDLLVENGGTSILGETPEHMGGEHILAARAASREVAEQFLALIREWEELARRENTELTNLSPGNIEGGLSTSEEKSLGCILKGGTAPLREVVRYSCKPSQKGLVVMDTPGSDIESLTGFVAGGAQIVLFTTGRGSPVGCPIAPVIKITGTPETYANMIENMDINAGKIIEGEATVGEVGREIFEEMIAVCNGKRTKAEQLGFGGFSIMRRSFTN